MQETTIMNIKTVLEENRLSLENGDGLRLTQKGKEFATEIIPSAVEPKPPRVQCLSWPILHAETSQYPVIAEHTTPSGLVVPDPKLLPAKSLQKPVATLPKSVESSPIDILRKMAAAVPMQYRPREKWRDELVNRVMACDIAEVLLNMLALQKSPELQKYFANGGGADVTMEINLRGIWERLNINAGCLWNIRSVDASIFAIRLVNYRGNFFTPEARIDLKAISEHYNYVPLLSIATIYNNQVESQLEKYSYEMAMRVCEDFSIDPAEYPCKSNLPFGEKDIQYSALTTQNRVVGGVPFRGKGGIRYYLQQWLIDGSVSGQEDEYVYVPVSSLVAKGCPLTRPSYVPPEEPLFFRQDEILQNDDRPVFMTSQLHFAIEAEAHAECIITTAWRLEECLNVEDVLPWAIFKGKVVFYLLIASSDPNAKKREFEMAIRVCSKLKTAGSAHPQIITVIDGQIGDDVYKEHEFWKARNALGIEEADMGDFPDLDEQPELPGGPTAIDYIKLKNLMLILWRRKGRQNLDVIAFGVQNGVQSECSQICGILLWRRREV